MIAFSDFQVGVSVLDVARDYLDLSEIAQNREWSDADASARLRRLMMEEGSWEPGWAYCMSFVKATYVQGYLNAGADPDLVRKVARKLTPSVMTSYSNCMPLITRDVPKTGAIGFMRNGTSWNGHAFLVVLASPRSRMLTLEGNTMPAAGVDAKQREGDGIYARADRRRDFTATKGLHLLGFLNPLGSADFERLARSL